MFWRRFLVLTLPLVLVVSAAAALWYARPQKLPVTIVVSGTRGMPVVLTSEEDGRTQEQEGVVPTEFALEGARVRFSLTTTANSGEFQVRAGIGGSMFGSATSQRPPKLGVRGWVRSGWRWSEPAHWLESFPRDEDTEWREPPP